MTKNENELHAMYEALNRETSEGAVAFRNYWRKESERWGRATRIVNSVVCGEITVTEKVIESCRIAVMQLHQINYVLGELMMSVGSPSPGVIYAVMDIIKRIEDDTRKATKNFKLILGWQAVTRNEVDNLEKITK